MEAVSKQSKQQYATHQQELQQLVSGHMAELARSKLSLDVFKEWTFGMEQKVVDEFYHLVQKNAQL